MKSSIWEMRPEMTSSVTLAEPYSPDLQSAAVIPLNIYILSKQAGASGKLAAIFPVFLHA